LVFYQARLPVSVPLLDLFFTVYGRHHTFMLLKINQLMNAEFFCEALINLFLCSQMRFIKSLVTPV
jgi:hypothetical protein